MPIYEYQCRKCRQVTEMLEVAHEGPLKKCPSCGGKVERQMSTGSFVLKGSGWYATDYASKSHDHGNGKGKGNGKGTPKGKDAGEASCPAASGAEAPAACAGCPKID